MICSVKDYSGSNSWSQCQGTLMSLSAWPQAGSLWQETNAEGSSRYRSPSWVPDDKTSLVTDWLQTRLVHFQAQRGPQWGFWEPRKANYNVNSHLPWQIFILSPQLSHRSSKGIRRDYAGVRERKTVLELFWVTRVWLWYRSQILRFVFACNSVTR